MPLDYSKFDKIADSDEEENYDDYLRARYGITSDWKPDSGMQPPVLGGRTPGKMYEDHEVEPLEFTEQEDDIAGGDATDERGAEALSASTNSSGGQRVRYLLVLLRIIEIIAWLLPTTAFVHITFFSNEQVKIEMAVYPITIALTFLMGFLDAVLAAMGTCVSEAPGLLAFACWFKRLFLAMSFLTYEAQFTSDGALLFGRVPLRLLLGLFMICIWSLRKLHGYSQDVRAIMKGTDNSSCTAVSLPRGRRLFVIEAVAELVFALVHAALLPRGVRFVGVSDPNVLRICTGVCLLLANGIAFASAWRAFGSKASKGMKDE